MTPQNTVPPALPMSDDAVLAYNLEIACCGGHFSIKRSLDLARRIEGIFGPIEPIAQKLELGALTLAQVAAVYGVLLKGQPDAPKLADIEAWVFEEGGFAAGNRVAFFVFSLVMGSARLKSELERIAAREKHGEDAQPGRRPFTTAGA